MKKIASLLLVTACFGCVTTSEKDDSPEEAAQRRIVREELQQRDEVKAIAGLATLGVLLVLTAATAGH